MPNPTNTTFTCFALAMLLTTSGCNDDSVGQGAQPAAAPYVFNWPAIADSSSTALTTNFWNPGERHFNTDNQGNTQFQYWPQAHALDVLVDAYVRTGDSRYAALMNDWFAGVKQGNGNTFLNEYYDDMGWNALAMLRAYDATKDAKWLNATQLVWDNIRTGWNDIQGGGIAWSKTQVGYKNTPAGGPACILAARLYQRFNRQTDLDWANKIYDWLKSNLVDAQSGLVYDGINRTGNGQIDLTWKFTYNQGLWIGAALELYHISKQPVYLNDAVRTANFTINDGSLTTGGLLRDEGTGDGGLFKGVFVRYFTLLTLDPDLPADARTRYAGFLKFNAETLWRKGTARPKITFGTNWSVPPANGITDLKVQLSGSMLLEAAASLKSRNLL